ncbi:MAG: IS66 family insertion sequence element accessory protein TnpB [Clostridia bacterium]|nr:IS66 family insertion sequence element accessory protein TnpB [Clostridia bacterium]
MGRRRLFAPVKRLENGRYRWPRNETEAKTLTKQHLRWLLEGLEIEQKKALCLPQKRSLFEPHLPKLWRKRMPWKRKFPI